MMGYLSEKREQGAAIVEMALITPLLMLLLLGMIEFGWVFAQNLDIKHGAREAARMISVNEDPGGPGTTQAERIINDVCGRMDLFPGTSVNLTQADTTVDSVATAQVSIQAGQNTLTGFLDWAIPASFTITSTVETRLQKAADWTGESRTC